MSAEGYGSPPTRFARKAERSDLPLKGGGQNQDGAISSFTSPLEGEVAEVALQALVTTDWSSVGAQLLLFAFLVGPPLFLALLTWRRREHPARSRVLFGVAAAVAVGGLGVLGLNVYRFDTDPQFRRTPNMYGLVVPLVQWGVVVAVWLWLVIQEAREKRAARQAAQAAPIWPRAPGGNQAKPPQSS